jgi:hypothetical protein
MEEDPLRAGTPGGAPEQALGRSVVHPVEQTRAAGLGGGHHIPRQYHRRSATRWPFQGSAQPALHPVARHLAPQQKAGVRAAVAGVSVARNQ